MEMNPYSNPAEEARTWLTRIAEGQRDGKLRMDAVMHCLSALREFRKLNQQVVNSISMEISLLGLEGLDINKPDKKYTLKTLKGEFTGLQLVSYLYVAMQRVAPETDVGVDLSREYKHAVELFEGEARK